MGIKTRGLKGVVFKRAREEKINHWKETLQSHYVVKQNKSRNGYVYNNLVKRKRK